MHFQDKRRSIFLYDLLTQQITQITAPISSQNSPSISGNGIVWQDNRNGISQIFMYQLSPQTSSNCGNMMACGPGYYCNPSATCQVRPSATVMISSPTPNATFTVGDTTNFFGLTSGTDNATLLQVGLVIEMDGNSVCQGEGFGCDTSITGSLFGPHVFGPSEVGQHSISGIAYIAGVDGTLVSIGQSQAYTITVNPAPVIQSFSTPALTVGDPTTTVMVQGQNFTPSTEVAVNGQVQTSTYVSSTQVSVTLPNSLLQTPQTLNVAAFNAAFSTVAVMGQMSDLQVVPVPQSAITILLVWLPIFQSMDHCKCKTKAIPRVTHGLSRQREEESRRRHLLYRQITRPHPLIL